MEIKRICNVVAVSTAKSNIGYRKDFDNAWWVRDKPLITSNDKTWQAVNLYVVSDERFEKDDWILHIGEVRKASSKIVEAQGNITRLNWKKIISTNDKALTIKEGQTFKDISPVSGRTTFDTVIINKPLPQIPKEFIEKYCKLGGIDKVMVVYSLEWEIKTDSHNTITIKPVKDNWSREEVINFGKKCFDYGVKAESGQIGFKEYGKELDWIKLN